MSIFIPNTTKYNKYFKLRNKHNMFDSKATQLKFGNYGIKAVSSGFLTVKHLETLRLFLRRKLNKGSIIWFRLYPNISISKKPIEVRMGKGKGAHNHWAFFIKKGRIIFEINGVNQFNLNKTLVQCQSKLPFRSCIINLII